MSAAGLAEHSDATAAEHSGAAALCSLRLRVEELEKENEWLRWRISSCKCSEITKEAPRYSLRDETTREDCPETDTSTKDKMEDRPRVDIYLEQSNNTDGLETTGRQEETVNDRPLRYIALKIMYFGQRYYGFASEAQMEPTIESEMFKALVRTKLLIGTRKESCYSRCGRTDKGVSATGQVISLYLRTNVKSIGDASNDKGAVEEKSEIDYVRVLNRVLPKDIRVLGWCPIPDGFHARFSCLSRVYRYLFWKGNLDILEMQKAASKFTGEHDFRNFCKMDAANVSNYRRNITNFSISYYNQSSSSDELWEMTIEGSAFLWHQVRCMVAILFLIGQGLESSNIVDELLDITGVPRKPQYNMAPELPLILQSCNFDHLNFRCSADAGQALKDHLEKEYHSFMLQAAIFQEALSGLISCGDDTRVHRKEIRHIPLMKRQTEPSYEERRAKLDRKIDR